MIYTNLRISRDYPPFCCIPFLHFVWAKNSFVFDMFRLKYRFQQSHLIGLFYFQNVDEWGTSSNHCWGYRSCNLWNSFEDKAPAGFIYECTMFWSAAGTRRVFPSMVSVLLGSDDRWSTMRHRPLGSDPLPWLMPIYISCIYIYIYIFVVVNFDALAQASDIRI